MFGKRGFARTWCSFQRWIDHLLVRQISWKKTQKPKSEEIEMRLQEMKPVGETNRPNLQLTEVPVTSTGMLIRKPVAEVFEAFVNPNITTKFWFTKGSERLEAGKQVQWDWEMYDISVPVTAKVIERNKRITIEWRDIAVRQPWNGYFRHMRLPRPSSISPRAASRVTGTN